MPVSKSEVKLSLKAKDILNPYDSASVVARQTIVDASGREVVAEVDEDWRDHIILAVNSHDGMLAALKAADHFLTERGLVGEMPAVIRAAIALAEGTR